MKLNLGSGTEQIKGFISVDIREEVNPDILDDISILNKIKNKSVQEIRASHCLEHFPYWQTKEIINTWKRKLQKDGKILVFVPDLLYIIREWISEKKTMSFETLIQYIYGQQSYAYNYHYTGFSEYNLKRLFEGEGFKNVAVDASDGNLTLTAWK